MKKEIKLICQNPDCKKEFYVDRKHIHSKYCSKNVHILFTTKKLMQKNVKRLVNRTKINHV